MSAVKYEIGSQVWRATWDIAPDYVVCPDCGGTGRIRVIFHDDTEASIACGNCAKGYDSPTGHITVHTRRPRAKLSLVCGFEVNASKIEYKVDAFTGGYYCVNESELFDTEEEALAFATAKCAKADQEERDRIATKEKDTRSWAWNASYHRQCIKRAQKDIEYHTAKLAVAALKAKEKIT